MQRIVLICFALLLLAGSAAGAGVERLRIDGWPVDLYDEGKQVRILVGGETWIYTRAADGSGKMEGPEKGLYFDRAVKALTEWESRQGVIAPEEPGQGGAAFVPGVLLLLAGLFGLISPMGLSQMIGRGSRNGEPDAATRRRYRAGGAVALLVGLLLLFI